MLKIDQLYKITTAADLYLKIAKGEISEYDYYEIFGFRTNVPTGSLQDICQIPGISVIPYPNGIQCRIVSSSVNDAAAGTGIRTLEIAYLDTNYNMQVENITMNGTTPVNTVATNIQRIWWIHAITVGSDGVAAGNISLQNTAGTVTYEYIAAGENRSLTSHFTIPNNTTGYVLGWQASSVLAAGAIRLRATSHYHNRVLTLSPNVFIFHGSLVLNNSSQYKPFMIPAKFPARTDIKISSIMAAATNYVSGGFEILLIAD